MSPPEVRIFPQCNGPAKGEQLQLSAAPRQLWHHRRMDFELWDEAQHPNACLKVTLLLKNISKDLGVMRNSPWDGKIGKTMGHMGVRSTYWDIQTSMQLETREWVCTYIGTHPSECQGMQVVLSRQAIHPRWWIHQLALVFGRLTEVVFFMGRVAQTWTKTSSKRHHEALTFPTGLVVHFVRNVERMKHESTSCCCSESPQTYNLSWV